MRVMCMGWGWGLGGWVDGVDRMGKVGADDESRE